MVVPLKPVANPSLARRRLLQAGLGVATITGLLPACSRRELSPDFSYTLLDGSAGRSQSLRGKVLLVNFWATSCAVCVKEMPQIVATHRIFQPRGYDTLAVAMRYDPPAYVAHFAETRGLPFGVVIDNTGAIARAWGDVQVTPTSFLVDRKGAIVRRYVGAPDFTALHALVEQVLAEA